MAVMAPKQYGLENGPWEGEGIVVSSWIYCCTPRAATRL